MTRRAVLLLLPLVLVALVEVGFRYGAWEPLAAPLSHAGQAIRMKRLWLAHEQPMAVVTLGSSRAVYGLDHAELAQAARRHGLVHGSFALAGSHWMSVRATSRWLEANRPEVRHRVIALSYLDFQFAGNGPYELALVEPLRGWRDVAWIREHVPFASEAVATYGVYSSLMQYRGDVADLVRHPVQRWRDIRDDRKSPAIRLFDGPNDVDTICQVDTQDIASCMAGRTSGSAVEERLRGQCRSLAPVRRPLPASTDAGAANVALLHGRELIAAELRHPRWRGRTTVVLMPTHHVWGREIAPPGLEVSVRAWLQALATEGAIDLLDLGAYFDAAGRTDCHAFIDLYHQNRPAARNLTRQLVERLDATAYQQRP